MDLIILLKAIIIGIIEGLTEFIPVSSTAHLILFSKVSDFSYVKNGVFEIVIQLGAILAICVLYFQKLFKVATGFFSDSDSRSFVYNVLLAFIPSVLFGILMYDIIKNVFFDVTYIGFALIIGGIAIILIERSNIKPKFDNIDKLSRKTSLMIGFCQVLAMIPGVSRSGATIMGSLLLQLDRKTATEFSFFLAIPTIFGAVFYDLYKNWHLMNFDNLLVIACGFISAFISALCVIKWLINFVSNNNFMIFAYYRIIIGSVILFIVFAGG